MDYFYGAFAFKQETNSNLFSKKEPVVSTEEMIKSKIEKINAYRARIKQKSAVFSRNIHKKDSENVQKRTSSKTESGIAGASTRESQS